MKLIDADKLIKDIKLSNLEFVTNGNTILDFIINKINTQSCIALIENIKNDTAIPMKGDNE